MKTVAQQLAETYANMRLARLNLIGEESETPNTPMYNYILPNVAAALKRMSETGYTPKPYSDGVYSSDEASKSPAVDVWRRLQDAKNPPRKMGRTAPKSQVPVNEGLVDITGKLIKGGLKTYTGAKTIGGLAAAGGLAGAGIGAASGYNEPVETPERIGGSWNPMTQYDTAAKAAEVAGNMLSGAVTGGLRGAGIGGGLGVLSVTPGKRQALKTAQTAAEIAADEIARLTAKGVEVALPPTARVAGRLAGQAATSSAGRAVGEFVRDEASGAGRAARLLKTAGKVAKVLGPVAVAAGIADAATAANPEDQKLAGAALINPFIAAGQLLGLETPTQKKQREEQELKDVLEKGVYGPPTQTPVNENTLPNVLAEHWTRMASLYR